VSFASRGDGIVALRVMGTAMSASLGFLACTAALAAGAGVASAADIRLPEGPGANLVYAKCQTCHDLQYVVDAKGLLPAQWRAVIASMHDYGLTATKDEDETLVRYLTTYLGHAPAPAATAAPGSTAAHTTADGSALYQQTCATCHGAEGRGQPGAFPPLAGNRDLALDNGAFPVTVVLNGLEGPIEVNGSTYDSAMPPFAHLSDVDIAAVVNFVHGAWGNNALPAAEVTPAQVAQRRAKPITAADVHAYRATALQHK
jgi:mono/diheme cytochrome c family protein